MITAARATPMAFVVVKVIFGLWANQREGNKFEKRKVFNNVHLNIQCFLSPQ